MIIKEIKFKICYTNIILLLNRLLHSVDVKKKYSFKQNYEISFILFDFSNSSIVYSESQSSPKFFEKKA